GKCSHISCRMAAAQKFAQSVALYADQIVVPDPLTHLFLNEQPLPDWFWEHIHVELQVLKYLLPLLKAGVMTLSSPVRHFCSDHKQEFETSVRDAASTLVQNLSDSVRVNLVDTGSIPYLFVIDFQRKFRERLCRLVHVPELCTGAS